jgi:hypothetical protein
MSDMHERDEIEKKDEFPEHVEMDVPEADALEQEREWEPGSERPNPDIPIDVNEADALDQSREAGQEPEEPR